MSNRILVSVQEELTSPVWLEQIEPYLQKVLAALGYDGQEISVLFCNDRFIQADRKSVV